MKKPKIKMLAVFTASLLASILIPVFGQWYEQQTGIFPIVFYILLVIFAIPVILITIVDVLDNHNNFKSE
jgi:uncharacterized membrane protein